MPKNNKKNERENLKTEKGFNMTMKKIVTNNHEVVTTEQEKKEGYIRDFISEEWVKDRPEEQVRQTYLRKLVEEYGYNPKNTCMPIII